MIKRFLNNKLVRRTIWDKVDYSFRRYVEDTQTCYFVLFYADVVVNMKYAGYNYWQNENSLCHLADIVKNSLYQALCAKDICEFVAEHEKENINEALKAFAYRIKLINNLELDDSLQIKYKDELSELFLFFLQNFTI